ncbi:outer membrane protein OmpA-like peptidoglycan-associated protein [Lewinella aquimaris]|uniref:Outer membrane protein OmpA-like peptidoglycan-associated protein n=1 Tax=Neolewinella aquimaris TaxID=1835722 RepID=A0A840DXH5_9BACT|nr:hypothetical protein [Neolewinella aquimaris]MBB4077914.1 outer membrane protein OmpA-like peptidoglycan-associated protein [Neolewinella aquimaris]
MKITFAILCFGIFLTACIPKAQYETLATERDYYRNQALTSDSLSAALTLAVRDSTRREADLDKEQLRTIENLTATNLNLERTLRELRGRYDDMLQQNSLLVAGNESDIATLQEDLSLRSAELSKQEASLRQRRLELDARERQLSGLSTQRGLQGTNPVDPVSDAVLLTDRLYDELQQLLIATVDDGYTLVRNSGSTLALTLSDSLLFDPNQEISLEGQRILRKLTATLRNYPRADYRVIGHAESTDGQVLRAYEESFARSARIAVVFTKFGLDGARILPAGLGIYGTENVAELGGGRPERRTRLLISFPADRP